METTPLVLVELADLDVADLDAMLAAELDEPAAALPGPGDGDELAALLADVLRSTGTAAALAHRLGAHAALLAD
ncbi:hypothetical protein ACWKWC_24710 [Geodermatophilus nigrescens]|uniref:hypothetical protein n=1 Tax=Geodermatophilus sp. FMUSA9-8 TaxID=3120155 RepID=UPI00300907A2